MRVRQRAIPEGRLLHHWASGGCIYTGCPPTGALSGIQRQHVGDMTTENIQDNETRLTEAWLRQTAWLKDNSRW